MSSESPLRRLAKNFADKSITIRTYRESRRDLLKNIFSDKVELTTISYPPLVSSLQERSYNDNDSPITAFGIPATDSPTLNEPSEKTTKGKRLPNLSLIVVCLIFLLVLGSILWGSKNLLKPAPTTTLTDNSKISSITTKNPIEEKNPAEQLLINFLAEKKWRTASLKTFENNWQLLSSHNRNTVLQTTIITHMADAIYQRLLEERALTNITGNKESLLRQQELVEFAETIGIKDPRIK